MQFQSNIFEKFSTLNISTIPVVLFISMYLYAYVVIQLNAANLFRGELMITAYEL